MDLTGKRCIPCEAGVPPLPLDSVDFLLDEQKLAPAWSRGERDGHPEIASEYRFADFVAAVSFVRDVADLAEDEGHHPDILIHSYRNVRIMLWTHALGGISENDLILAAKIQRLAAQGHEVQA